MRQTQVYYLYVWYLFYYTIVALINCIPVHSTFMMILVGCGLVVLTDLAPMTTRHLFIAPAITLQSAIACRIFRQTVLDIADIRSRVDERQDTIQFRRDVELSAAFSTNGMDVEGLVSDHAYFD